MWWDGVRFACICPPRFKLPVERRVDGGGDWPDKRVRNTVGTVMAAESLTATIEVEEDSSSI